MRTTIGQYARIDADDMVMLRCWARHLLGYDKYLELLTARATAHFVWSNPRVTQRSARHGEEVKSWN
jgi:hypothetical protein